MLHLGILSLLTSLNSWEIAETTKLQNHDMTILWWHSDKLWDLGFGSNFQPYNRTPYSNLDAAWFYPEIRSNSKGGILNLWKPWLGVDHGLSCFIIQIKRSISSAMSIQWDLVTALHSGNFFSRPRRRQNLQYLKQMLTSSPRCRKKMMFWIVG